MTNLASFLGKKAAPPSEEGPVRPAVVAEATKKGEQSPALTTGDPVATPITVTDITPSGIEVLYQAAPKRLYKVRWPGTNLDGELVETEWREVPSVTSVLDVLSKDGLPWWGQGQGVGGVLELFARGKLATAFNWKTEREEVYVYADDLEPATVDSIVKLLTENKLTVNHQRDKAADRGVNVHDALEQWAKSNGEFFPTPAGFAAEERPYVEAVLAWIDAVEAKPVMCEVMVGSVAHGYAGRYDLVIEIPEEREVVVRSGKRPKTAVVPAGRVLCDLKSSKRTYKTHHIQLAAYELAAVECGYPPTDYQAIIHVQADGQYEFVVSRAVGGDFLAVKSVHDRLKGLS